MIPNAINIGCWIADTSTGMSPETVGGIIAALIVALIGAGLLGKRSATIQRVRFAEPMQEMPMKRVSTPPTWDQHAGLERRVSVIEQSQLEMRRDLAAQYKELLEAGASREYRLSGKLEGIAREIQRRIDDTMQSSMVRSMENLSPPSRRTRKLP